MGFKEDDEYVARVVARQRDYKKSLICDFEVKDNSVTNSKVGKFRIDQVSGFEIFEGRIYIYLNGGYVVSDRNPLLEEKLNNLHLWIDRIQ